MDGNSMYFIFMPRSHWKSAPPGIDAVLKLFLINSFKASFCSCYCSGPFSGFSVCKLILSRLIVKCRRWCFQKEWDDSSWEACPQWDLEEAEPKGFLVFFFSPFLFLPSCSVALKTAFGREWLYIPFWVSRVELVLFWKQLWLALCYRLGFIYKNDLFLR